MGFWEIDASKPPMMTANFTPMCHFHPAVKLTPIKAEPICVDLQYNGSPRKGWAMDIWMKCPDCGAKEVFGVALSEGEYKEMCA